MNFTHSQIASWKSQHKRIHKLTPDPTRQELNCVVRHPEISDLRISWLHQSPLEQRIALFNEIWLGGDEGIKEDVELLYAVADSAYSLFKTYGYLIDAVKASEVFTKPLSEQHNERIQANNGDIRKITLILELDEKGTPLKTAVAYFHKPNIKVLKDAEVFEMMLDRGMHFYTHCLISADEEITHGDDEIQFSMYMACTKLLKSYQVQVEKL